MGYKQRIGYYNHHDYPVQFPLRSGRAAPVHLEPGQPVTDKDGFLIKPFQPELDDEVRAGTIAYACADNPKHKGYAEHDDVTRQRQTGTHVSRTDDGFPEDMRAETVSPNKQKAKPTPDVTVGAAAPPADTKSLEESEVTTDSETLMRPNEALDEWIARQTKAERLKVTANNRFEFDGRTFANKKALVKYLELLSSQALSPASRA